MAKVKVFCLLSVFSSFPPGCLGLGMKKIANIGSKTFGRQPELGLQFVCSLCDVMSQDPSRPCVPGALHLADVCSLDPGGDIAGEGDDNPAKRLHGIVSLLFLEKQRSPLI